MKSNEFGFCKIRKVKSPNRGTSKAAGIDFYVPEDLSSETMNEKAKITGCFPKTTVDRSTGSVTSISLEPGQSVMIPSGLKVRVPEGHALIFKNKSGIGCKKQLDVLACVIDEDYQGEVHINVVNAGLNLQVINAGDKLIQGLIVPINYAEPVEHETAEDLYADMDSARGEGGFGSTGTK